MKKKTSVTRRRFLAGTALGLASAGFDWPADLHAGISSAASQTEQVEPLILRLDRNESPYGVPPSSARAIQRASEINAARYPKDEPVTLADALAERLGVEPEQILLGCGSIEILKMATETFCSPSGAAVVAEPTYEAVVNYSPLVQARAVKIPLTRDYKHDLPRMLDAAILVGGFIFLCNPANPTGTIVDRKEVEKFIHSIPSGIVLLIDEAYFDYVETPAYESCLRYVKEGQPVLVSRTFSKIYGMAGLRIGYGVGHKDLIGRMRPRRLANNTNQIATAAALAGLGEDDFVAHVRKLNIQARELLCTELRGMRLEFIPSHTNFVMVNLGRPAQPVIDALQARGVLVGRMFPSMPHHMRITLGTAEEMKLLLKEFREVLKSLSWHP